MTDVEYKECLEVLTAMGMEEKKFDNQTLNILKTCMDIVKLFVKKNEDYADAFTEAIDRCGVDYPLGVMYAKVSRMISIAHISKPNFESIEDNAKDLACYAIMFHNYIKG